MAGFWVVMLTLFFIGWVLAILGFGAGAIALAAMGRINLAIIAGIVAGVLLLALTALILYARRRFPSE